MTVKELIAQLHNMPEEFEVKFAYSYGDRCHTTVAQDVLSVEEGDVEYSDYHRMAKVVDTSEYEADEHDAVHVGKRVVVLS